MGVEAAEGMAAERAAEVAQQLNVPVLSGMTSGPGVKLIVASGGLSLGFMDKSRGKPFVVDFLTAAWKSRFQQGLSRNHIFRRALGVHDEPLKVLDATAGFGQDAVLAASLNCAVTAVERSPVVAALLKDGIERAVREDEWMRAKLMDFAIHTVDSVEFLSKLKPALAPDVIYLDPMFEKPKKSAKSPKEMQLLQELLDPPKAGDEVQLFEAALAAAKRRVVVKRPLKARAVKSSPAHSYKGQSIRYDVYVKT